MEREEKKKWELKRAVKNTFKWDSTDWQYIKTHIIWILVILLLSYLYWSEVNITREYMKSPCVKQCQLNEYVKEFQEKNPTLGISCDYRLMTCTISGVYNESDVSKFKKLNILPQPKKLSGKKHR